VIGVAVLTAFTVMDRLVLSVSWPFTPVIETVALPTAAVDDAVSVITVDEVELAGLNTAVTPLGSPLAENAAAPVNPLIGATVIVEDPLAPCPMVRLPGAAVSAKFVLAVTARLSVVT